MVILSMFMQTIVGLLNVLVEENFTCQGRLLFPHFMNKNGFSAVNIAFLRFVLLSDWE